MPQIDDWIDSGEQSSEIFSASTGKIDLVSREQAQQMFPDVKLTDSANIVYFPFRLCSSLPTANQRGRAFTPRVLQNSFASLQDQLIDWEHMLNANPGKLGDDRIIGHVKASRFQMPSEMASMQPNEIASLSESIPVMGLGALFTRAKGVQQAVENHLKKCEKWGVSMECGHSWKNAYFLYRGEFIPAQDAEIAMRDCVKTDRINDYKGHKLIGCLGGIEGKVDFWGLGLTQNPADTTADILNMFAGSAHELASVHKIFYMPIYAFEGPASEVASKSDDKIFQELASISVIGSTDSAKSKDGSSHSHPILSNLSIVPHEGHTHSLYNVHISRGTKPTLTGVTSDHCQYGSEYANSDKEVSSGNWTHLHLVNVPLTGKMPPPEVTGPAAPYLDAEESSMKTLAQILQELTTALTKFSKTNDNNSREGMMPELASTVQAASEALSKQNTEEDKKAYLQSEVAAGNYISKEKHDKDLADAVEAAVEKAKEELSAEHKAELEGVEIRSRRSELCNTLKIDLDAELEGIKDAEGKPMTIRSRLDSIPVTKESEQEFDIQANLFSKIARLPDDSGKTETTSQTTQAEAASKARRVIPLAGGSSRSDSEQASGGDNQKQEPVTTGRQYGKTALRKLRK